MSATIQTASGRTIDIINPDPYDININDIAHALARLCRFGGHTKEFYSVAQHSLLCSLNVGAEHALAALMHDATEAYCGDMVGPLKCLLPAYQDIEAKLWETIAWKYRLPDELPEEVKRVDKALLATEQRDLKITNPCPACERNCLGGAQPLNFHITPMTVKAAQTTFLKQFHHLMEVRRDAKK